MRTCGAAREAVSRSCLKGSSAEPGRHINHKGTRKRKRRRGDEEEEGAGGGGGGAVGVRGGRLRACHCQKQQSFCRRCWLETPQEHLQTSGRHHMAARTGEAGWGRLITPDPLHLPNEKNKQTKTHTSSAKRNACKRGLICHCSHEISAQKPI